MKLFIYCAGGFGKEVMDSARRVNKSKNIWEEILFMDDMILDDIHYGARKFAFDQVIENFSIDTIEVAIANGEPEYRAELYEKLKSYHTKLATIIDETAIISETATIGEGVIILAYAYVSSLGKLGNNSVLYNYSGVGHEVTIKENCVISAGAIIAGNVLIKENTYIGLGAKIKERITIGKGAIIGMGAAVFKDIPDNCVALGNPAKRITKIDGKVFKG